MAQFEKHTWMIGGGLSAQAITDKVQSGSSPETTQDVQHILTFTPQGGYFIVDNLAIGAGLSFQHHVSTSKTSTSKFTSDNFSFSPFARYYFHRFFVQATASVGVGNQKVNNSPSLTTKNSSWGSTAAMGYAVLLTKNVAIEPQVGLAYTSFGYSDVDFRINDFQLYFKVSIQLYLHR